MSGTQGKASSLSNEKGRIKILPRFHKMDKQSHPGLPHHTRVEVMLSAHSQCKIILFPILDVDESIFPLHAL